MPNIQAISRERHAAKRWQRNTHYTFVAAEPFTPLVMQELPMAMQTMPIVFLEVKGAYMPYAMQGLALGKNLFVAGNGQWVGAYIPAALRAYPFGLVSTTDQQHVLCIDEDSGLLSDTTGESFWDASGQPSAALGEVFELLRTVETNRPVTQSICALLQKHLLIKPWLLKIKGENNEQTVEGLFCIDEAALNRLSAQVLLELRNAGALLCAYCQLLSMQNVQTLGQLASVHAKESAMARAPLPIKSKELDLSFLGDSGTMKFF